MREIVDDIMRSIPNPSDRTKALGERMCAYPYEKSARRLTGQELFAMVEFIKKNDQLPHLEFERAVNRMHLDRTDKPRNWTLMEALLIAANTVAKGNNK